MYFSSEGDVHFDVKPMGCGRVTTFPPGSVVAIFWESTPAKASLHASVVRMKCVPSKRGAVSTGSETRHALSLQKLPCVPPSSAAGACRLS